LAGSGCKSAVLLPVEEWNKKSGKPGLKEFLLLHSKGLKLEVPPRSTLKRKEPKAVA
jgi:hypothetical protein